MPSSRNGVQVQVLFFFFESKSKVQIPQKPLTNREAQICNISRHTLSGWPHMFTFRMSLLECLELLDHTNQTHKSSPSSFSVVK